MQNSWQFIFEFVFCNDETIEQAPELGVLAHVRSHLLSSQIGSLPSALLPHLVMLLLSSIPGGGLSKKKKKDHFGALVSHPVTG